VVALTLQLASDIVDTIIAPGWHEPGRLAAVAAILTFLAIFLDRNLGRARERELSEQQQDGAQASQLAPRATA
jgi:uncharacterized membrane protein